jgi:hypothetical protein
VVLKRKLASLLSICKRSERRAQGTFHEAATVLLATVLLATVLLAKVLLAKVLLAKVLLAKVQLGNAVKADTVVGLIRSD